jgi:TM2 domain-containing membrane protein YozV
MPRRPRRHRRNLPVQSGEKSLLLSYLFMVPPFGFLGFHKFYLGNIKHGLIYLLMSSIAIPSGVLGFLFGGFLFSIAAAIFLFFALVYDFFTLPAQVYESSGNLEWQGSMDDVVPEEIKSLFRQDTVIETAEYDVVKAESAPAAEAVESLEKQIIELAEKSDMSQLTLKDVIKAGYSLEEGKTVLEKLASEGVCEVVSMDGVRVYCF